MKFFRWTLGLVLILGMFVLVGCDGTDETANVEMNATEVAATQVVEAEATVEGDVGTPDRGGEYDGTIGG